MAGVSERGLALQLQDHEVATWELEREVLELRHLCVDEEKNGAPWIAVKLCIVVTPTV